MSFPTDVTDLSTTRASSGSDPLSSPDHLTHHQAEDEIATQLMGLVGTYNSSVQTSHNYKLALILGIYHAVATGGEQFIWGLKRFLDRVFVPSMYGELKTALDGATVVFNIRQSTRWQVTIADNRIFSVTDCEDGQSFYIRVKQGTGGSHTVTWWSGISWAGGSAPTLTTTENKVDTFIFIKTAAGAYDGYVAGQNV